MNSILHEYQHHNPNVEAAQPYYPSTNGGLMQLIAHDIETQKFSSTKSHVVLATKVRMEKVDAKTLKSNFIQNVDAFMFEAVYLEKVQHNTPVSNATLRIAEFSTILSSCPSTVDVTGSITYSIDRLVVRHTNDKDAHTIYIEHVPGFNTYIIGRAYLFDYDIRKRLFHKENFTFQDAVQCRIEDYPNQQPYAFGPDCPVTRINSLSTSTRLLSCTDAGGDGMRMQTLTSQEGGDVISIDKISICKPPYDPFSEIIDENESTILKIDNYTLPLSYVRNLPGAYTEDATHAHFNIPSYLLGYIPIFSYPNRSVNVELLNTNSKYNITYSTYTVPSTYKSFDPRPHKLYQYVNAHTNVTKQNANEIHIQVNGVGLTKGFFIESDKLDDVAKLSILYNGLERLTYDTKLMKHYTYRISNNLMYIPLSLVNDYQKCDRDSYQTGVSMGRISDLQIHVIFQKDVGACRAYSICIGSLDLNN